MAVQATPCVSTQAQDLAPRLRQLSAAGCTEIFEEKASGTSRARPELARLLDRLRPGDTLVVVRIDRLAQSLSQGRVGGNPALRSRDLAVLGRIPPRTSKQGSPPCC